MAEDWGDVTAEGNFKAHGLEGSLVEPDWPPLDLAEVNQLLRGYPQADGALRLLTRSPRPFSAAGLVETPRGNVFVKRHHSRVRDREGLLEEHRLIAHLASTDRAASGQALVLAPLADENGNTVAMEGDWVYEIHPVARGVDVYEQALSWTPFLSGGHAFAAGHAMARLHGDAKGYAAPRRRERQLVSSFTIFAAGYFRSEDQGEDLRQSPLTRMERYLDRRPALAAYAARRDWRRSFEELFLPRYEKLEPWLAYLPSLWTHNDFHASNLTWSGAASDQRVVNVIDFGLADRTNAVHDLATAIERNIVEWLRIEQMDNERIVHLDHLDALLDGYEESAPLSYEEAQALVAMLPLVHCEFALSETDYFLSILKSDEKAYLGYEGYFVAHAEWFRGVQGRRLLEHLERWVDSRERRHSESVTTR